jgi:hypothetical protein
MPSEVMDCFTAFAMTATFAMTGLFMESVSVTQSKKRPQAPFWI